MGLAGIQGMLRRTIYTNGLYRPHMAVALVGGVLLIVGLVAFVANLVVTLGVRNVIELFLPRKRSPQPAAQ
jgi:cytochrome c oxidase subunit 1